MKKMAYTVAAFFTTVFTTSFALAQDGAGYGGLSPQSAMAIALGIAAVGGTLAQGKAISAALDGIARNPSAQDKIFTPMILGLAFIESLVIFTLVYKFF